MSRSKVRYFSRSLISSLSIDELTDVFLSSTCGIKTLIGFHEKLADARAISIS